jgi:hemoglobin
MTTMTISEAPVAEPAVQTIYEAIGGRPALKAAVDGLFARLIADPELGRFFPAGVGQVHRGFLITLLGEALGGPERYRGPDLAVAHRGLSISGAHFNHTAALLDDTLDELGVPRDLIDQIIGIVATLRSAVVSA